MIKRDRISIILYEHTRLFMHSTCYKLFCYDLIGWS